MFDDDQIPKDNTIFEKLINDTINKNVMLGLKGYIIDRPFCSFSYKGHKHIKMEL